MEKLGKIKRKKNTLGASNKPKFDPMCQVEFKGDYVGLGFQGMVYETEADILEADFNAFV